jgi:hypothetical protein
MTKALFDKDIKKMAEILAGHDSASAYFLIAGFGLAKSSIVVKVS